MRPCSSLNLVFVLVLVFLRRAMAWWWGPSPTLSPSPFPTPAPTLYPTCYPTNVPTSEPTLSPRYTSTLSFTITSVSFSDLQNESFLMTSLRLAVASVLETSVNEVGNLTLIDSTNQNETSNASSYIITEYLSGLLNLTNCTYVTVLTKVTSKYDLITTQLMIANSTSELLDEFRERAYNINFTYGNYTGFPGNLSSCNIFQVSTQSLAPTALPTADPTSTPSTSAPTCAAGTFQILHLEYQGTGYDDAAKSNVTGLNRSQDYKYLHYFLLGDWGKGGNSGDITGEATSLPTMAPTSPTSIPSVYPFSSLNRRSLRFYHEGFLCLEHLIARNSLVCNFCRYIPKC